MSKMEVDNVKVEEEEIAVNKPDPKHEEVDISKEHRQELEAGDEKKIILLQSAQQEQQEEEVIKKKYGGMLPRKPPLISKDHERAFFDSADWALGKQGSGKPKGPLEALRPKLQPTPHQHVKRSAYAPADDHDEGAVLLNPESDRTDTQECNLEDSHSKMIPEPSCCQEKKSN